MPTARVASPAIFSFFAAGAIVARASCRDSRARRRHLGKNSAITAFLQLQQPLVMIGQPFD
jgi:hypothetical protein